jgi:hypothetical protein
MNMNGGWNVIQNQQAQFNQRYAPRQFQMQRGMTYPNNQVNPNANSNARYGMFNPNAQVNVNGLN